MRSTRGGFVALIIVGAALVAAGCGSGGGGANDAVSNSKALDFIPKDAIAYVTVDTDFQGDNWDHANTLATAFDAKFKPVDEQIDTEVGKGDSACGDVSFSDDVQPWLGKSGGAAFLQTAVKSNGDEGIVAWVELKDRAKAEKFLKQCKFTKDGTAGDFALWKHDKDEFALSDDLAFAGSKKTLSATVKYDGDSITDADGIDDVTGDLDGDSLAAIVVSGSGARTALKASGQVTKAQLDAVPALQDFKGFAASAAAEDNGFRVHAVAKGKGLDAKNASPDLLKALPGNTLLAIGGQDFGGQLKQGVSSAGKSNAQVQQAVGAAEGALGIDIDDLAKALSGEFQLALGGEDAGLQSLVGSVAGAAMGGGLQGVDPSALTKAGAITLAFENSDSTPETLDKLFGAVGGLTGGATPKSGTAGDFETKTLDVQGIPVTAASSDDVSAISVGTDVFGTWGDDKLSDNDTFSGAWDAADAPDEVTASFWLDWPRVAKFAGVTGGDKATAGGWVGWGELDGDSASFDLFMHVKKS